MTEPVYDPTPASATPGPDHRAPDVVTTAPSKAFWRTALQVGPVALLSLVVILPSIIQDVVDQFGAHLPENFRVWLTGFAAVLTLIASIIAHVMARPDVIAWTRKYVPFFAPTK
jgi:hypothetical protein